MKRKRKGKSKEENKKKKYCFEVSLKKNTSGTLAELLFVDTVLENIVSFACEEIEENGFIKYDKKNACLYYNPFMFVSMNFYYYTIRHTSVWFFYDAPKQHMNFHNLRLAYVHSSIELQLLKRKLSKLKHKVQCLEYRYTTIFNPKKTGGVGSLEEIDMTYEKKKYTKRNEINYLKYKRANLDTILDNDSDDDDYVE